MTPAEQKDRIAEAEELGFPDYLYTYEVDANTGEPVLVTWARTYSRVQNRRLDYKANIGDRRWRVYQRGDGRFTRATRLTTSGTELHRERTPALEALLTRAKTDAEQAREAATRAMDHAGKLTERHLALAAWRDAEVAAQYRRRELGTGFHSDEYGETILFILDGLPRRGTYLGRPGSDGLITVALFGEDGHKALIKPEQVVGFENVDGQRFVGPPEAA